MKPCRLATALLLLSAACASAPPKMSLAEAGLAPEPESVEREENAVAPRAPPPRERVAHTPIAPLYEGVLRFSGIERELRAQHRGHPMPGDAVRAWSGLFAAIDRSLDGAQRPAPLDLVRARVAADAELVLDAEAYASLPAGLEAAVRARMRGLTYRLRHSKLEEPPPAPADLSWPIWPVRITSLFGPRIDPFDHHTWKRHEGLDLLASPGQLVAAAAHGVVVDAGWHCGYGLSVTVAHAGGIMTRYGHLSQILTAVGLAVDRGGAVGLAGSTGRSTGPHLHFEVWRDGRARDPLVELGDPALAPDGPMAAAY